MFRRWRIVNNLGCWFMLLVMVYRVAKYPSLSAWDAFGPLVGMLLWSAFTIVGGIAEYAIRRKFSSKEAG